MSHSQAGNRGKAVRESSALILEAILSATQKQSIPTDITKQLHAKGLLESPSIRRIYGQKKECFVLEYYFFFEGTEFSGVIGFDEHFAIISIDTKKPKEETCIIEPRII